MQMGPNIFCFLFFCMFKEFYCPHAVRGESLSLTLGSRLALGSRLLG